MKKLLIGLLALGSLAVFAAPVSNGSAKVYNTADNKSQIITIQGDAAKVLFNRMENVDIGDLGNRQIQRVGNNLSCVKSYLRNNKSSFQCEIIIEDDKGTIGHPGHG